MKRPTKKADIITEKQLMKWIEVTEAALTKLRREEGFPYLKIDGWKRVYNVNYVINWLDTRKQGQCS